MLSAKQIRDLAYSLAKLDHTKSSDFGLQKKLEAAGITLEDYLVFSKDPEVAGETIRVALSLYFLPQVGMMIERVAREAGDKGDIKNALELLKKLSPLLKEDKSKTENHLHIYKEMDDDSLLRELEEQRGVVEKLQASLPTKAKVIGAPRNAKLETRPKVEFIRDQTKGN